MRILLVVGGKSPGIEHVRQLRRKLREMTVRGGEAGLRKERNKELTSQRASIDLTPLPKLTNYQSTLDHQLLPIHHLIHHPTSKQLHTRCQQNTPDPLLLLVPVSVLLPPVLDPQVRPDPRPALNLLPTHRPIMHTIKGNSSSPWPSPSRGRRSRCHCGAPWAPQSSEEQTSQNSSMRARASPLAPGPTRRPKMLSQHSRTTVWRRSRKQSR